MNNYTMKIFESQFNKCYEQLSLLGYKDELNKKQYQFQFMDSLSVLGRCRNHGGNRYTIYLNKHHVDISEEKDILNTVMHELIHSLDNCMCHTGRWKSVANIVNRAYGYNITRTESDDEAYNAYYTATKLQRAKYEIKCNCCGATAMYQRKSKAVTDISQHRGTYYCNKCKARNDFTVTELT